jgi:2-polyprenyl-6-methoxyphenol hydroxylase-like FAD-dependent oxidoreductase
MEQSDGGVQVTFERAPARWFDLVVGADGLHSAVRKLVFGSEDRFEKYLGYIVAAFEVEGGRRIPAPQRRRLRFLCRAGQTGSTFCDEG